MKTGIRPAEWGKPAHQFSRVSLVNMLLQQGKGSHTAMVRYFIIRNDHDIYQGKIAAVEVFRQ